MGTSPHRWIPFVGNAPEHVRLGGSTLGRTGSRLPPCRGQHHKDLDENGRGAERDRVSCVCALKVVRDDWVEFITLM